MGDNQESTSAGPNPLIFDNEICAKIKESRVLVVGAGGIGCELLKNLVLTGFENIEIIDLDTIDVSNLNRQFLFHKKHVGMSKAQVAKESVLQFNPNAKVIAHHASIVSSDYSVSFFQEFNLVLNALDNRAARNHVNRLCLAAGVPLVESGTAGYSGQVEAIVKERTACYECSAKPKERTFPGCTIRNTPSELIHCIVWAKHLFNQLFGQHDPQGEDTDVSPDSTDSEAGGGEDGTKRLETRLWVREVAYDGEQIFQKLFVDDIHTLLKMKNLWEKRQAPRPLTLQQAHSLDNVPSQQSNGQPKMKEERLWSISECAEMFLQSIKGLKKLMDESSHDYLEWDKDDKFSMEFVAATANIRAHIFGINQKSLFDIKSMAGNIIPAIATSNAVIAGLIVLNAVNILRGHLDQCQSVYLRREPGPRGILISRETALAPPNPDCKSCSKKPMVTIATDLSKMKLKDFDSLVLKEWLNMTEADVILVRTGNMILSSEEGEAEDLKERTLLDLGVGDGSLLEADDFLQNFKILIITKQRTLERDDPPFLVLEKTGDLTPKEQENGKKEIPGPSRQEDDDDDDDDLEMILEGDAPPRKRKGDSSPTPAKRMRKADDQNADDLIIL